MNNSFRSMEEEYGTWNSTYGFMEDLFSCMMRAHQVNWTPLGIAYPLNPRIFTPAVGCIVLQTDPGLSESVRVLDTFQDCRQFVFRLGHALFTPRPFEWPAFRVFLSAVGTVGVRVMRRYSVLTADDMMVCAAEFVREELLQGIWGSGGWTAFQVDCLRMVMRQELVVSRGGFVTHPIPTAPSDMPSDPLLSNEYPTPVSNPYPSKYQQSMHTNMDASAVRVLPTHYIPSNKLRPVYCFSTEEPA